MCGSCRRSMAGRTTRTSLCGAFVSVSALTALASIPSATSPAVDGSATRSAASGTLRWLALARPRDKSGRGHSERQAGQTFGDLIGLFVQKHGPTMRPLSLIEFQRAANHDVLPVFGSRRPADITRADIRSLLERILARGAPTQAKRTLALVRAVFRWSIR